MVNLRNISFSYHRYDGKETLPLFSDLTFSLAPLENALILSPPDSGKSTLSRILCSLATRHNEGVVTGEMSIFNTNLLTTMPWDLTDIVTLVSQNSSEQLMMSSCGEEIAFPLESLALPQKEIHRRVDEALHSWDLLRYKERNPQELSGGEQKRLLLAVADALDTPLWVLDEPFDNLDTQWREKLVDLLTSKKRSVIVFASRFLPIYEELFHAYYYLDEKGLHHSDSKQLSEMDPLMPLPKVTTSVPHLSNIQMKTLQCKNVHIDHTTPSSDSKALFHLSVPHFELHKDEVVALVGPNGSGKTTFSRHLCGLQALQEGSITINNELIDQFRLKREVGYLFQNPDFDLFLPTVREELIYAHRFNKDLTSQQKKEMVHTCASMYHLDVDAHPTMMSYGSRKGVQAAIYHLLNRPFIILDELDSGVTYQRACEIVSLLRSRGSTLLVITHDPMFAQHIADRQYSIVDGAMIETEVGS